MDVAETEGVVAVYAVVCNGSFASATCVPSDNVDMDHAEPKEPDTLEHVDIVVKTVANTAKCTQVYERWFA